MKAVIQRVSQARVDVADETVGRIGRGILVLLGVEKSDARKEADWLVEKIANLRIFEDTAGKMNFSLMDIGGELLVVSQFTLAGNCAKGRRPSFDSAAPPTEANELYEYFVGKAKDLGLQTATGIFQADMKVELINDGPVTFILETP